MNHYSGMPFGDWLSLTALIQGDPGVPAWIARQASYDFDAATPPPETAGRATARLSGLQPRLYFPRVFPVEVGSDPAHLKV
jgi:hypothetical protein